MDAYWKQRIAENTKERKALEFARTVSGWCDIYGVDFRFVTDSDRVMYPGERCAPVAGYFDSDGDSPTLCIAVGCHIDRWLPILAHEYCHMVQWVEQTELWVKSQSDDLADIDQWIAGKNYGHTDVETALIAIRDMELECEQKAVAVIREYKLPIDIPDYVRGANAYVLFHNVLLHTRKWCSIGPYRVPEITSRMPDTFSEYAGLDVSQELLELYKLHCYK